MIIASKKEMNNMDVGIGIIFLLIMSVVFGIIRGRTAENEIRKAKARDDEKRQKNDDRLKNAAAELGIGCDLAVITGSMAAAYDKQQYRLAVISDKIDGGKAVLDLSLVEKIRVVDSVMDHKYYQRQARAFTGLDRYSEFSKKEAKYGYEQLMKSIGQPIYSLDFILKQGGFVKVPLICSDGTLNWNK